MKKSIIKVWIEAKKEPVFSLLYIGGVAFAIAFIMIYAILYYVQAAPIYPEYERGKTLKIDQATLETDNITMVSNISNKFINEHLSHIEGYDAMAAVSGNKTFVQPNNQAPEFKVMTKSVNPDFFRLFAYRFLQGSPFTDEQMSSEQKIVIITDQTARQAFGTAEDAVGKEISINMDPYTVVGVVRQSSPIAQNSFAHLFLPNRPADPSQEIGNLNDMLGGNDVYISLKPGYQAEDIQRQIDEITSRLLATDTVFSKFYINPASNITQVALSNFSHTHTWTDVIKQHLLMLVVLLIIPALNISGMIGAQMERKYSEIGIRRSFGATKGDILRQVMLENLYLTIAGGIIGLMISWIFIYISQGWIFDLIGGNRLSGTNGLDKDVSAEMLFAPSVFIITFIICLLLNLASAYIPVRWALRKQVVTYINENK